MLKILHVAEYAKGGVATVINELLSSQNKTHNTFVLVNESHADYINPSQQVFTYRGSRSILGLMLFTAKLIYVYLKLKPDVVHLHSSFAGAIGRLVLVFFPPKIIYQSHGVSFDPQRVTGIKKKLLTFTERLLSFLSDATIAISHYEFNLLCNVTNRNKVHLIENGVSDTLLKKQSNNRNGKLLFVGRLDYQKGFDLIVDYFEKYNTSFTLDVAGEQVLGDSKKRHSTPNINYLGWLPPEELEKKYADYTAVIMPSRWEGFGLVAIESLRAGTPVISSDRGALPSIISDNFNGLIFSIENFEKDFQHCLATLEAKPASFFEKNCRETYETKFNANIMASKIERLYISTLNSTKQSPPRTPHTH
ncbi:Glycogen synthase [compost metagenome]|jgi:glycosyltransferase involved in cell wall biosynthesis